MKDILIIGISVTVGVVLFLMLYNKKHEGNSDSLYNKNLKLDVDFTIDSLPGNSIENLELNLEIEDNSEQKSTRAGSPEKSSSINIEAENFSEAFSKFMQVMVESAADSIVSNDSILKKIFHFNGENIHFSFNIGKDS